MYGNYGRQEDLDFLQKNNIELNGSVLLLRAGKISFAEQASADLAPSICLVSLFFLVFQELD